LERFESSSLLEASFADRRGENSVLFTFRGEFRGVADFEVSLGGQRFDRCLERQFGVEREQ
jgi:hypothetical protein